MWVLSAYDNPASDPRHQELFLRTLAPIMDTAGGVVVAEAVYPGGTELPDLPCRHLRYPCREVAWQQERLLNMALDEVPEGAEFVAWISNEVLFEDPTWMQQSVERLQTGAGALALFDPQGFAGRRASHCPACQPGATFAWATETAPLRESRLYDRSLTGENAQLIAHALTGLRSVGCVTARLGHGTPAQRDFESWAEQLPVQARSCLPGRIAPIPQPIRRNSRHNEALLGGRRIRFDPTLDLEFTPEGLHRFPDDRTDLTDWARAYFRGERAGGGAPTAHRGGQVAATRLLRAGRVGDARDLLHGLIGDGVAPSQCLRLLGQVEAREGNWVEAAEFYDEALSCMDADIRAHLDLAEAMQHLGCDDWAPVAELRCFAADATGVPSSTMIAQLTRTADRRYEFARHAEAEVLYGYVLRHHPDDNRVRGRLADCQLRAGEPRTALTTLEGRSPSRAPNGPDVRLRARIYLQLGLIQPAAAILRDLIAREPPHAETIRLLFTALELGEAIDELAAPGALVRGLEPAERFELSLRAALSRGDDHEVARLYEGERGPAVDAGDPVLSATIRSLTKDRDFGRIDRLLSITGRTRPYDADLLITAIDAVMAQQDWARASELVAHGELAWPDADDARLRVRQLMVDCLSLDLEAAEARLHGWGTLEEIPEIATPPVAALLAARGRWEEVLDLFRDRIERDYEVRAHLFLECVVKAARHTGRYAETVDLVDQALGTWPAQGLWDFRDRLIAEMDLALALGRTPPDPAPTEQIRSPFYAERTALVSRTLNRNPPPAGQRTIYFCTDYNYLSGTMVGLFSLLRNNPTVGRRARLQVIVSDDARPIAEPAIEEVGAAFATTITVVPASDLVSDEYTFRTTWGAFTPGHALSDAAYYRIFAAARLLESGTGGRGLYLDSDICVGGGIERLLDFDLRGMPLGARPELPLPEIHSAARRLNVPLESYFNSGVLLFDLTHPDLAEGLTNAIDFAVHKPELLTFVDQCALNIAFLDRATDLPPECNYFLRQEDAWRLTWEPTVLHYLARPKPWDPTYRGSNCRRWLQEFELLGQVVSPEHLRAVMAGMFPSTGPQDLTSDSRTAPSRAPGSR